MKNKLVNTLLVLVAAIIAPLALVYATTYGATSSPENQAFPYLNQGIEHVEQGEWQLALEDLNDAIENDPENPETRHLRGYVYTELGRYDLALIDYNRAIDLGIEFPELTYYARGITSLQRGDLTQGMADMKEAIQIDPNFADAYFVRGLIFSDIGETERAIDELEKALDLGLEKEAREYAETVLTELKAE